ncbi:hypothetical protein [Sedimentibacter sp. MB31-C6]|uniref:hypothetical protein n=1 Tax=Sedimentibacter sp. MB31-C6 TaxID=3109366 RepID=UPI002DDD9734|nr:hypothetical protein [Sedimentibacter sp. MB36-C1]WSI02852.1 hypothetical protein U8307_07295 [Sedimentibacter sp. MB36-C1]
MNNKINKNNKNNIEKPKTAFNDIKLFLYLLLCSELLMLYYSVRQMFFQNIDCSSRVAGINTVLLISTIIHIRKIKIREK